uniref:Uncharacterized protein n=1 Tax=Racemicystis crocea TaxID=1707966 RepID=A0A3S5GYP1_9BACT|nr:hypothetical protein [Racemicystis crocea]
MNRSVLVWAGLILSVAAVGAGCKGSETTPSGSGGGGPVVSPEEGKQACVDVCNLYTGICSDPTDICVPRCNEEFANASAECQDEISALYACYKDVLDAQHDTLTCPIYPPHECSKLAGASVGCINMYGCSRLGDCSYQPGPNGENLYSCEEQCDAQGLRKDCWTDGTKTTCECMVQGKPAGTCDNGDVAFDDPSMLTSCCYQFLQNP